VAAAARELPNLIEAEQALLGAILVNNVAYDRVKQFLLPEHWYEPLHQRIYMMAAELIESGRLTTPITLKPYLPKDVRIGDLTMMQYLTALAGQAVGIMQAREFGMAIHELYIRRQLIAATEPFVDLLYDAPPHINVVKDRTVEENLARARAESVQDENRRGIGQRYLDHMDQQEKLGMAAGVPLFMNEIGRVICEPTLAAGNLYGLVASSGEGKTSWMLQLAWHAVEQGHPVLVQSYDQDSNQFMRQLTAQVLMIEARRQAMLQITPKEREQIVDLMLTVDRRNLIMVEKCHKQSATQLVSMAEGFCRTKYNGKTPLIITDHIQAVEPDQQFGGKRGGDRETEGTKVKAINKTIKTGADTAGAAWLMLNQRNTLGTIRPNPRPIPSDVHGGQGALYSYDTMIYLYRFKKFLEERKATASMAKDWTEIEKVFPSDVRQGADIVEMGALKVRFGNMYQDAARLDFEGKYTRYVDKQQAAQDQEELAVFLAAGGR
jgi:replicative DNA helicase